MDDTLLKMYQLAKIAQQNAYAPYSNFVVGACIQSKKLNYFTGCNLENAAYGLSTCAEAGALCELIKSGERNINRVVIVGVGNAYCAPCGSCRQKLWEFAGQETSVHFFNEVGEYKTALLVDLLPFPFS